MCSTSRASNRSRRCRSRSVIQRQNVPISYSFRLSWAIARVCGHKKRPHLDPASSAQSLKLALPADFARFCAILEAKCVRHAALRARCPARARTQPRMALPRGCVNFRGDSLRRLRPRRIERARLCALVRVCCLPASRCAPARLLAARCAHTSHPDPSARVCLASHPLCARKLPNTFLQHSHVGGTCEPNAPHFLGQPCVSERSSWTFSHLLMVFVNCGPCMCSRRHLVP